LIEARLVSCATWTPPYSDDRDTAAEPLNKNDAFEEDMKDENEIITSGEYTKEFSLTLTTLQ